MSDFSKYKIKDYKYWHVSVHPAQGYLGQCVIWCKREDALDLADATSMEREELFILLQELRGASKKLFQAEWFNYSFLGNSTRHLHGHFMPRYSSPREFAGKVFVDKEWGGPPDFNKDSKVSDELWQAIRSKLMQTLG